MLKREMLSRKGFCRKINRAKIKQQSITIAKELPYPRNKKLDFYLNFVSNPEGNFSIKQSNKKSPISKIESKMTGKSSMTLN